MPATLSAAVSNLYTAGVFTLLHTGGSRWVLFTPEGVGVPAAAQLLAAAGITAWAITDSWVTERGRAVTHLVAG